MKKAPLLVDEADRLKALYRYDVLDSVPEAEFDDLVEIASFVCQTPVALISLVDSSRQWFKSKKGTDHCQTGRDESFCAHALNQNHSLVVPDTTQDERFFDNPLVTGPLGIRFYAGAPLITPSGHKIGTICVIDTSPRGISQTQIQALEALARQTVQILELRLKVKELEEAKTDLQKANGEIQRTARVKSEFLANMSHEIRTPMNGIIGMTEIALLEEARPEQRERLQIIETSSQMLLTLINDILDYSKIDAGKLHLENVPFNINLAGREIFDLLKPMAERKLISLEIKTPPTVPEWIIGDSTRFKQILTNLVYNAIKFTSVGGVIIEMNSEKLDKKDECKIHVSVIDSGIGIPKTAQERLFQSFSQADASTTRRYGGTGLGLAISKALCEQMNGKIWFSSQEGNGSRFEFDLIAPLASAPGMLGDRVLDGEAFAANCPLEILIVEDNSINQRVLTGYLAKLGYEADLANDGAEALKMLTKKTYSLIFMDCHMPVLDGFETTEKIRAMGPADRQPRIIALTASAMKEDEDHCLRAGMDAFLSKPITFGALKKALDIRPSGDSARLPRDHEAVPRIVESKWTA